MALRAFAGGALYGEVGGAGPPAVLALHGWARSRTDFRMVLAGLDGLALDLPGFGASPAPPEAWGGAEYARALLPALEVCAPPAVVVGHSFGGRVAVHLGALRPDLVAGLVLTGVPLVRPPGAVRPRSPRAFRAGRWLHRRGLLSPGRMEALRRRYGSADYRAAEGVMRAVLVRAVNETYEQPLGALRCPVELVWGGADTVVPPTVAEAAAPLVGSGAPRLTVLTGVGHQTPLEAPDDLRAAVRRLVPEPPA